jgi:glycosyltransferase involved in cell wall biosynthesis
MAAPRLTIGLPVYNGEHYLEESLDALLGQTFEDFELIVSDNASTDGTADICRRYEQLDPRVRYVRQPRNLGAAGNHNFVVDQARAELFKWASADDLYARDLIERCVAALDANPHVVLAHSWTAMIDAAGSVTAAVKYPLDTSSMRAPERFRSMLFESGGDDYYGVIRTDVIRRVVPQGSYHHADRTIVTDLALQGPFFQIPDWLYFRRDHPEQAERTCTTMRLRCEHADPRRGDRLRHPAVRLYGEYLWSYLSAVSNAPLSAADRRECYRYFAQWAASRSHPASFRAPAETPQSAPVIVPIETVVAGRQRSAS